EAFQRLASDAEAPSSASFLAMLVRCCEELLDGGDSQAASKLIDSVANDGQLTSEFSVRLEILNARALRNTGHYERSLRLCRSLLSPQSNAATFLSDEQRILLRILENAALWQLNACDQAIEELVSTRRELLRQGDSPLLARCTMELSSALLFKGDLDAARY